MRKPNRSCISWAEYIIAHAAYRVSRKKRPSIAYKDERNPRKALAKAIGDLKQEYSLLTKRFHLGDVLSIATGRLVSSRGMDGVYDILNFMTGDSLYTHQLPRACKECRPYLLEQFPELARAGILENFTKLDALIEDSKNHGRESADTAIRMWLKWMAEPENCNLKEEYEVRYIPLDAHLIRDPIEEMEAIAGDPKKVIVIKTE